MSAYVLAGGYLILVALLITAIGIAQQLRIARDEARDIAEQADDDAARWYAAHNLAAKGSELWRTRCAEAEAERDHARRTILAVLEHGERRRMRAVDAVLDELSEKRRKPRAVKAVK